MVYFYSDCGYLFVSGLSLRLTISRGRTDHIATTVGTVIGHIFFGIGNIVIVFSRTFTAVGLRQGTTRLILAKVETAFTGEARLELIQLALKVVNVVQETVLVSQQLIDPHAELCDLRGVFGVVPGVISFELASQRDTCSERKSFHLRVGMHSVATRLSRIFLNGHIMLASEFLHTVALGVHRSRGEDTLMVLTIPFLRLTEHVRGEVLVHVLVHLADNKAIGLLLWVIDGSQRFGVTVQQLEVTVHRRWIWCLRIGNEEQALLVMDLLYKGVVGHDSTVSQTTTVVIMSPIPCVIMGSKLTEVDNCLITTNVICVDNYQYSPRPKRAEHGRIERVVSDRFRPTVTHALRRILRRATHYIIVDARLGSDKIREETARLTSRGP